MPKRKIKNKKQQNNGLEQSILTILRKDHSRPHNYKQIAGKLGLDDASSRNQIIKKLKALQIQGTIKEVDRGQYTIATSKNYYTGRVDIAGRGQGYIIVEELEDDIFVNNKNLNKALNGDIVEVYVFNRKKGGKNEGEITRIVERKKTEFVGTIQVQDNFAFVDVTDHKMHTDIFVPKNKIKDAKNGEIVLVKMEDWPEKADSPFGKFMQY